MLTFLAASMLLATADSIPVRPTSLVMPVPAAVTMPPGAPSTDTLTRRRAISYSDWYGRRLAVHRYGSYVMLPLFVAQYALGNSMLRQKEQLYAGTRFVPIDKDLLSTHKMVAGGVGTLFAVNTTTGLWNLYASRKDPAKRTLRFVHALSMLASDGGFVATGLVARSAVKHGLPDARTHRNIALGSMGVATLGASLMWFSDHH